MIEKLFALRGNLDRKTTLFLEITGLVLLILVWHLLTLGSDPIIKTAILPKPLDVLTAFKGLIQENELIKNICRSLGYNIAGYVEAILIAIPVGFLLGLIPVVRGLFRQPIDALRYVPLPAAIGLFISLFGLGTELKVHFLAFGIIIYLVPVVVQRINEVDEVYLKTVYTLGANWWNTIRTVYIPSVISRISDDIRVLTAISWTYIIIAESIGSRGGLGALIWRIGQRQGRMDVVYALLLVIIVIGILQDKLFMNLDKEFFPHKYVTKSSYIKEQASKNTILNMILRFGKEIVIWIVLAAYLLLLINEFTGIISNQKILDYLFGDTASVIHLLMLTTLAYKVWKLFKKK